jgi:hypothetical protein
VKEPIVTPRPSPAHEAIGDQKLLVHNWRVARLTQLGVAMVAAGRRYAIEGKG